MTTFAELLAERNRLRDDLEALRRTFGADLVRQLEEAQAERDRLREMVDAARAFSAAHKVWIARATDAGVSPADEESRHRAAMLATLVHLVDELDGDGVMGGFDG